MKIAFVSAGLWFFVGLIVCFMFFTSSESSDASRLIAAAIGAGVVACARFFYKMDVLLGEEKKRRSRSEVEK